MLAEDSTFSLERPQGARHPILVGMFAGVLVYLAILAWMLSMTLSFSIMGSSDAGVTHIVLTEKLWRVIGVIASILGAHIALGVLFGGLFTIAWRAILGSFGKSWIRPFLLSFFSVAIFHAGVLATHLRQSPQAYVETFYKQGGLGAAIQYGLTHQMPDAFFAGLKIACLSFLAVAVIRGFMTFRAGGRVLLTLVLIVCAGLGYKFTRLEISPLATDRLNVLILADDSLRPDRFSAHGYLRPLTPNIDEFIKESVDFTDAYTPIARTFPSWASTLTGRWPHEHGIRHMFPSPEDRLQNETTMADVFREAGYRTAVIADYAGDIFTRFDSGFESIEAPKFDADALIGQRALQFQPSIIPYLENPLGRRLFPDLIGLPEVPRTRVTLDKLFKSIASGDGRPFFITSFVSASHFPFAAPEPHYRTYVDPNYRGASLYMRYPTLSEDPSSLQAEGVQVSALYDGTVAAFDEAFGEFWRRFKEAGFAENTIVVLMADHGESLTENGVLGHGDHLRGSEISHIPLVIYVPKMAARQVDALVRSVDLAPTLYELTGVKTPSDLKLSGRSLGALMRGEADESRTAFAETGLWFNDKGNEFYFEERLPYPILMSTCELRTDFKGEICLKPIYEDIMRTAKHRAAWNQAHKVIYIPTENGVIFEGYKRIGLVETPEAEPDSEVKQQLLEWIRSDATMQMDDALFVQAIDPVAKAVSNDPVEILEHPQTQAVLAQPERPWTDALPPVQVEEPELDSTEGSEEGKEDLEMKEDLPVLPAEL